LRGFRGYSILRPLGEGGSGAVFLARRGATDELVALKVMQPHLAADPLAREGFLREAENTRALCHRHIVRFREVACWCGCFCFALEYCDGGSVDRLVRPGVGLPVAEAVGLIVQALDGLEYAHQAPIPFVRLDDGSYLPGHGLVHRDIKPSNLFLSGTGAERVVKVGDFGLSKAFDDAGLSGLTRSGVTRGTPEFLPRQQVIEFKYAKPEVDVWAMVASLYYLLTGAYPRDFSGGVDRWLAVLQSAAVPIRRRNPALPRRLAAVIDHALVDEPQIGVKSAAELRAALLAAV
jgi:serine/threonine-protein kinase